MIEIERRFLLKTHPSRTFGENDAFLDKTLQISQFYIHGLRYRRIREVSTSFNNNLIYERIKKISIGDGMNNETEVTTISRKEWEDTYHHSFSNKYPHIDKRRYVFKWNKSNLKFEIDDFSESVIKLLILEVEIPSRDYEIIFPENIKKQIITEITANKDFSNYNLAKLNQNG